MARDRKFPWFRVYSELANERKLLMIAHLTGLSKCEVIGAFTIIMCMANDSPERGKLLIAENNPLTQADIASELEIDLMSYQKLDNEFVRFGLISWDDGVCTIRNWNKRQHKSDDPYERVTKHRENKDQDVTAPLQERYSNDEVTFDSVSVSASVSDSLINNKDAKNAFRLYEQEIGLITPYIADAIGGELDNNIPFDWIKRAIEIAVANNARSWAYIAAVLKNWKENGFEDKRKKSNNGKQPPPKIDWSTCPTCGRQLPDGSECPVCAAEEIEEND